MIVSASWVSSTTDWGCYNRTNASESQVSYINKTQNIGTEDVGNVQHTELSMCQHTELSMC